MLEMPETVAREPDSTRPGVSQEFAVVGSRRVLVVAPQPFFQERGTPIALLHVVRSLSDLGFNVDILTYPLGESLVIPDVRYFRVPNLLRFRTIPIGLSFRKVWLDVFLWRELRRLLRTGEYDCVHAVEEAAFFAVLVARPLGVPVVYDMQSSMVEQLWRHWPLRFGPVRRFVQWCERWLLRSVDRVACSAGLENRVRRHVADAHVLRWTFPGTYQESAASARDELRAELGIRRDQMVVVYTGNFAEYQGVMELAEAITRVCAACPQVVFVFVGGGIHEAGAVGRRLESTVPREAYRMVPRQPASRMPKYLAAADIAVSPRRHGSNLPLKVIEYLAAGLPIVATNITAHTTLLDDEIALLVEPDPAGIARGTITLLQDVERRVRYRAAAKDFASRHLGTAAFHLSVAHLYDSLDHVGLPYATGRRPAQ